MTTMPGRKHLQHRRVLQGEVQYRLWLSAEAEAAVQQQCRRGETFEQAVNRMLLAPPALPLEAPTGQRRLQPPPGDPYPLDPILELIVRRLVYELTARSPGLQRCWPDVEQLAALLAMWPRSD